MGDLIFITGASSDIGLSIIENLTSESRIIAHYNSDNSQLIKLSKRIKNELITIRADFSNENSIIEMIKEVESKFGVPNKILHLAAPKFQNIRFKDLLWNDFQNDIDISLKSIFLILNFWLPKMAAAKFGKIVFILSSVTLNVPPKALAEYTTIKYALLGLMKSLASEYADKKINVNSISPSMVETKFLSLINEKFIEISAQSNPLKRNAKVEDLNGILNLLFSNESDFINGINIPITGGSIF
jgi:3-oxoacyl-[acyl-carrier protein] reductase